MRGPVNRMRMSQPIIRGTFETDAGELVRLAAQLGYSVPESAVRSRIARINGSSNDCLLVAENPDGTLAGWIHGYLSQLVESEFRVEIGGLIVDEASRRRGVGRLLVQRIEVWAAEHGARELSVRCQEARHESHRFYESLKFVHTKTQRVFRKRLGGGEASPGSA